MNVGHLTRSMSLALAAETFTGQMPHSFLVCG